MTQCFCFPFFSLALVKFDAAFFFCAWYRRVLSLGGKEWLAFI